MAPPDLSSLRGRRVLITGPARGIGAALAERMAAHGARLALVGPVVGAKLPFTASSEATV